MVILLGLGAFVCTLLGGLFALRYRDKLHLILGFSAGSVIGVAFFDLLPESMELGNSFGISFIATMIALGFVAFMLLDRLVINHGHGDNCDHPEHRGWFGAGSLSLHSFIDGLAIGFAFKVSASVGTVVALAVLVHGFSDGINTVALISKNGGSKMQAFKWLLLDAVAPFVGVLATFLFTLREETLGLILAVFCGSFLYIGASDLLPESHHRHPTYWTTFSTVLGVVVLYTVIRLAGV